MEDSLLQFGLTTFTTLLVVVDPFGVLPIYLGLATGRPQTERAGIVTRAVVLSFGISLFFLIAGQGALAYLGVSVHAFSISGGILLFATAMPMLFGQRPALQSHEGSERGPEDIAIFPLAIPLLAGPGTITTILLLTARAGHDPVRIGVLVVALAVVFAITRFVLGVGSERLLRRVGNGGIHVITRVLGVLLAAMAVQFVLNGLADYARLLKASLP